MADVSTLAELYLDCLQDLMANEEATVERLQGVVDHATLPKLKTALTDHREESRRQAERLRDLIQACGEKPDGPKCLWAEAILEDADRDAKTVEPGRFLDIALVGAVRKLEASEIVSYETAIAVAAALGREDAAAELESIRKEEVAMDQHLGLLLATLTSG